MFAHLDRANQAIIGFPDDASWKDVKFEKADEDEPGLHPTLVAQTRLGEPSVVTIPLWKEDVFHAEAIPDFTQAKQWFLRALSLSRKGVVKKLQANGVPEGWKKSSLLRNCFPLLLNDQKRWVEDETVRMDDELGLVYEPKESR